MDVIQNLRQFVACNNFDNFQDMLLIIIVICFISMHKDYLYICILQQSNETNSAWKKKGQEI